MSTIGTVATRTHVPHGRVTTTAVERLRPLVHAAGELEPGDVAGWARLRERARDDLTDLAASGALPHHLVVDEHDPPAVVSRLLVAAWLRATSPAGLRHHRV